MTPAKLYIWIVSVAFVALTCVMLFLPRSRYSELEKRDLAEFPEFSASKLADASYAKELSSWFSDTEPFRDEFMSTSMKVRDLIRFSFASDEEAISFHKGDSNASGQPLSANANGEDLEEYENHINADENAKIGGSGIIIVGSGDKVRALNAFGGSATGGEAFANAVSEYQKEMPWVKVYAMVIPLSSEFYTPDKAKKVTNPQQPFIKNIYSKLENGARGVNAYNALADHVEEDIYLRTDHHWAPLGAYYAAKEFASAAGVPFKPLSSYTKNVIHGYVGSMYGYSNDIALKKAPEDFVYYTPNGIDYTTTYWIYDVNKNYKVTRERKPMDGAYFVKYHDGSGAAYSTFMGGDQKLTRVKTSANIGRKLLVIKDSYGNALPGYLFYSFDEIHIVDFRYFTRNMKKYVRENGITDLVFCVNVFNAYSSSAANKIMNFLKQADGTFSAGDSNHGDSNHKEGGEKSNAKETNKEKASNKEKSRLKAEGEEPKVNSEKEPVQEPSDQPSAVTEE
ncbi:MAG: hypothetical protein K2H96_01000 [Muribaculaceae bacterium]|nr:hypothetical protein [Muribaculaceae bacterium]